MNWRDLLRPRYRAARRRPNSRVLLVTGASGSVAKLLVPLLRANGHSLRLADRIGSGDEKADLCDAATCDRIVAGVSGIVHLAGAAKESTIEALFADNTVALVNVLRSARRANVTHFVFASSMHVMGMYRRDEAIDEGSPPRPDSYYAASKLHGEALCRVFHEKSGLSVTCLRLGSVTAREEEADPGAWISPEDVAAMIDVALALPAHSFEIFHAVADYKGSPSPASRASRFGYRCAKPGDYQAALRKIQAWWHSDEIARTRRGASFAANPLDESENVNRADCTSPGHADDLSH